MAQCGIHLLVVSRKEGNILHRGCIGITFPYNPTRHQEVKFLGGIATQNLIHGFRVYG